MLINIEWYSDEDSDVTEFDIWTLSNFYKLYYYFLYYSYSTVYATFGTFSNFVINSSNFTL